MSTVELPGDGGTHHDLPADVQVVTPQLVGNAYRHARPPRRPRWHRQDVVRVEIDDGSPLPVPGRLDAPAHGRGRLLWIVPAQGGVAAW